MQKINFKGLGTKAVGLAAGSVAAGLVQNGLKKMGLEGMTSNLGVIAVGALGPDLLGKKNPMITAAGDAVMTMGIQGLLKGQFPNLPIYAVGGLDDVAGPYDNIAGDYPGGDYEVGDVDDEGIVSGADDDTDGVSGNSL